MWTAVYIMALMLSFGMCNEVGGELVSDICYIPEGRSSCGPYFIIIGSMKCGTTSLFSYLLNHFQILPLREDANLNGPILANKEIRFFLDPLYSNFIRKYGYSETINKYYDLFPHIEPHASSPSLITGEATPMYVIDPLIPQRVKKVLPHGKFIWMMRNPIDRAYSEFWFQNSMRTSTEEKETPSYFIQQQQYFKQCAEAEISLLNHCNISSYYHDISIDNLSAFSQCLKDTGTIINHVRGACDETSEYYNLCAPPDARRKCIPWMLKNSIYYLQLFPWIHEFSSHQILFSKSEDFYSQTASFMDTVTDFLKIKKMDWSGIVDSVVNIIPAGDSSQSLTMGAVGTSSYPAIDFETKSLLANFFAPYNEKLKKAINITWE